MKVSEFVGRLTEHIKLNPDIGEHELRIPIHLHGSMGGTPSVGVKSLSMGFDWDKGIYFINPDAKLQEKPPDPPPAKKVRDGYCPSCDKPYKPIVDGTASTGSVCNCPWNWRKEPD